MKDPATDLVRQIGMERVLLQLINYTHELAEEYQEPYIIQLRADLSTAYSHYMDRYKPKSIGEKISSIGQRLRKIKWWKPNSCM